MTDRCGRPRAISVYAGGTSEKETVRIRNYTELTPLQAEMYRRMSQWSNHPRRAARPPQQ